MTGEMPKCLVVKCTRFPSHRGLCVVCWGQAKKAMESGMATEADLIAKGMLLPKTDPFTEQLKEGK